MFEVTVRIQNNEIDLLVPKKVTVDRLQMLLINTFLEQGITFPGKISLKIKGKTTSIKRSDMLSQFGVGSGEKLEIVLEEGEKENESF